MQKAMPAGRQGFAAFTVFLGIILIVGGIIGGGWYLNKYSISTSIVKKVKKDNFNIYKNEKLGIQFQYSKNLKVQEDSEEEFNKRGNGDFRKNFTSFVGYEPGKFLGAVVVLEKDGSFDTNPLTLWIFDNPNDLSIDSWFDKYWYYPFLWGVFDYVSKGHVALDKEATVSGVLAKYRIVSYQSGSPKYIYILKDKKMYLLRIIGNTGDQILQSFNF